MGRPWALRALTASTTSKIVTSVPAPWIHSRYARDLLLAGVEYNPEDALSVLYLAHSYFELGDFVNARKWYARRVERVAGKWRSTSRCTGSQSRWRNSCAV